MNENQVKFLKKEKNNNNNKKYKIPWKNLQKKLQKAEKTKLFLIEKHFVKKDRLQTPRPYFMNEWVLPQNKNQTKITKPIKFTKKLPKRGGLPISYTWDL